MSTCLRSLVEHGRLYLYLSVLGVGEHITIVIILLLVNLLMCNPKVQECNSV